MRGGHLTVSIDCRRFGSMLQSADLNGGATLGRRLLINSGVSPQPDGISLQGRAEKLWRLPPDRYPMHTPAPFVRKPPINRWRPPPQKRRVYARSNQIKTICSRRERAVVRFDGRLAGKGKMLMLKRPLKDLPGFGNRDRALKSIDTQLLTDFLEIHQAARASPLHV